MGSKRKRGAKEDPAAATNTQKRTKKGAAAPVIPILAAPKPNLADVPFVEIPTADERKREGAVYELLGSENENDRIEAADCIVTGLLGGEGVSEPILQRHLDRRLFRGLSSGRNASRIGFSLVITEILSQLFGGGGKGSKYPGLTFEKILSFLTEKSQVVGNIPGQEERDIFFGQLFGLECFVKSRTLFAEPSRWAVILEELLRLGNRKVWMRSQCGWVLVQALEYMSQKQARSLLEKLADAGLAKTPEGVAVWLVALDRFPDLKVKPWGHPLSNKPLGDLAAVLKESFNSESSKDAAPNAPRNKQANWTAQLHFVWDVILGYYAKARDDGADDFSQFWGRVIDDGLFSKQATDGQKFKGFMVFQKMLEGFADQHRKLQVLFSKNLMACLMNQAAKEDRYLNRAATKALKAVEAVVSEHPDALAPVLDNLLGKNGAYSFDQRTSTKTVDKLLQNLNSDNEKATLKVIKRPIPTLSQHEDAEAQAILRAYVDYLSKVLGASAGAKVTTSDTGRISSLGFALQELSRLGFSKPKDISDKVMTERIRDFARSRLESSLAKLTRQAADFAMFCGAVASIDLSSVTMSDEIKQAIEGALTRMRKFLSHKPKSEDDKGLNQGLAMLHAISIFQLYNEDPDAMDVLDDLAQFHERLKKRKAGAGADDDDAAAAGSSEFLVEILLSMVSRPSSLLRQVSQQVFEAFTGQISAGGLELLTGPLEAGESAKGQQELFNTENDAMDVDEDEGSEDDDDDDAEDVKEASDFEIDSDVEFVDLKDADAADSKSEDDDDDDDDGDDEEDGNDDDDDEEEEKEEEEGKQGLEDLDELVGKILKSHRLDKDANAESSESEGDMSDSEMLALDDKLAEVFKHRVQARPDSKREKKDAKQSVVNFKHRILDFLDIFIKNEPLSPLAFSLLLPLLRLMRTTSTKTLASRACEIILSYQRALKKARGDSKPPAPKSSSTKQDDDDDDEDEEEDDGDDGDERYERDDDELLAMLVQVHDEAGRDNAHAYARAASAASLILASAMYAADRRSVGRAAGVYAKTQSDWVLGKAKLQNSFFADWNNWCQNHASQARS
ncbi:DNA polymerase V [Escovopsis weberi]|uniref:DNA polymerase V n=1 Tax=Escovopsis weberi TaxID=150374 RepID=A0A0M8MXZ0_ESCWE|nr:DNA polymerase V [Escovopsis weberi]